MIEDNKLHFVAIPIEKAKSLGMKRYQTVFPCRHGHLEERLVSTRTCVGCIRDKSRKRMQESPEKFRSYGKKYRESCAPGSMAERHRLWRLNNPEKVREGNRKYRENNRHVRKSWERNNIAKRRKYYAEARASREMRNVSDGCELTDLVSQECYSLARQRGEMHGFEWHVDHCLPMKAKNVSGLHIAHNLQVIPAATNLKKGNRLVCTEPLDWMKS